ncbi:hypothetical protein V8C86DRAFT_2947290, partial [Haematococcus lacustris]
MQDDKQKPTEGNGSDVAPSEDSDVNAASGDELGGNAACQAHKDRKSGKAKMRRRLHSYGKRANAAHPEMEAVIFSTTGRYHGCSQLDLSGCNVNAACKDVTGLFQGLLGLLGMLTCSVESVRTAAGVAMVQAYRQIENIPGWVSLPVTTTTRWAPQTLAGRGKAGSKGKGKASGASQLSLMGAGTPTGSQRQGQGEVFGGVPTQHASVAELLQPHSQPRSLFNTILPNDVQPAISTPLSPPPVESLLHNLLCRNALEGVRAGSGLLCSPRSSPAQPPLAKRSAIQQPVCSMS